MEQLLISWLLHKSIYGSVHINSPSLSYSDPSVCGLSDLLQWGPNKADGQHLVLYLGSLPPYPYTIKFYNLQEITFPVSELATYAISHPPLTMAQ